MKSTTNKSNVSILHLRNTSEPWTNNGGTRIYLRSSTADYKMNKSRYNYPPISEQKNDATLKEIFYSPKTQPRNVTDNEKNEYLSPVKWRNKEVDGVYLESSGWMKITQTDVSCKNRRRSYSDSGVEDDTIPIIKPPKKFSNNNHHHHQHKCKHSVNPASTIIVAPCCGRNWENMLTEVTTSNVKNSSNGSGDFSYSPIITPPPAFQDDHRGRKLTPAHSPSSDCEPIWRSTVLDNAEVCCCSSHCRRCCCCHFHSKNFHSDVEKDRRCRYSSNDKIIENEHLLNKAVYSKRRGNLSSEIYRNDENKLNFFDVDKKIAINDRNGGRIMSARDRYDDLVEMEERVKDFNLNNQQNTKWWETEKKISRGQIKQNSFEQYAGSTRGQYNSVKEFSADFVPLEKNDPVTKNFHMKNSRYINDDDDNNTKKPPQELGPIFSADNDNFYNNNNKFVVINDANRVNFYDDGSNNSSLSRRNKKYVDSLHYHADDYSSSGSEEIISTCGDSLLRSDFRSADGIFRNYSYYNDKATSGDVFLHSYDGNNGSFSQRCERQTGTCTCDYNEEPFYYNIYSADSVDNKIETFNVKCKICGCDFDERDTECVRYQPTGELYHIDCFDNKIIDENGDINPIYKNRSIVNRWHNNDNGRKYDLTSDLLSPVFDSRLKIDHTTGDNVSRSRTESQRIGSLKSTSNKNRPDWRKSFSANNTDTNNYNHIDNNMNNRAKNKSPMSREIRQSPTIVERKTNIIKPSKYNNGGHIATVTIINTTTNNVTTTTNVYLPHPSVKKNKFDTMPSRYSANVSYASDTNAKQRCQKSPVRNYCLNPKVGSFNSGKNNEINFPTEETKKKSSSLPKSFQRNDFLRKELKYRDNSGLKFGWYKNGVKNLINKKVLVASSIMSETAPTTPVRDMPERKKYGRLMKINQYSSTPSLDDNIIQNIGFDCDTRYLFKDSNCASKMKNEKSATISNGAPGSCHSNITTAPNLSDRMIHKFCKSFSWRFLRKVNNEDHDLNCDTNATNGYDKLIDDSVATTKKHNYRFGPLSWRCSKERKEKLSTTSSVKSDEADAVGPDKVNGNVSVQRQDNLTLVRRTLSDLNGYRDIVKLKTTCSVVPIKYRPPAPVAMKKHRQYELRRTVSQPLLTTARFSPALERKMPVSRIVQSEDERLVFSEDDMMSDSGSSIPSRKNSLEQGINEDIVIYSEALWDHIAMETEELPFRAGDVIEVYSALDRDWWWGTCCGKSGWFPSDFVRLRVNQNENAVGSNAVNFANIDDSNIIRSYSSDQVRSRIVCELINTERDFVKILKNINEAYILECRKARDLFTDEQIFTIFGNWEQLCSFQSEFFKSLEENINWETPYKSCVGNTFLQNHEKFCIYSDYCNNHPISIATLQQLYQNSTYNAFFEKCRIKASLMEIPLDGFLLTPVQRICKYPLQLAELLKHTEVSHEDYEDVKSALDTMKNVAMLINERKRRMESLEKLILWQQRVDCWEGEDLILRSSQLIYQSEVTKIATGTFITNAMLFLFDHQLVYCKKDILKKNYYIYKGRMLLDNSEIVDVPDGKDNVLGFNIRNGVKVQNAKLHKWLLFCCRSQKEKSEWLDAFNRERKLINKDEQNKLKITSTDRHLAYITAAACSRRHTFVKHSSKKIKRGTNRTARIVNRTNGSSHLSRKVGTWFMFGAGRKNHRSSRLIP